MSLTPLARLEEAACHLDAVVSHLFAHKQRTLGEELSAIYSRLREFIEQRSEFVDDEEATLP